MELRQIILTALAFTATIASGQDKKIAEFLISKNN